MSSVLVNLCYPWWGIVHSLLSQDPDTERENALTKKTAQGGLVSSTARPLVV